MTRPVWFALVVAALSAAAAATPFEQQAHGGQQPPAEQLERCLCLQVFIRGDSEVCQDAVQYAETFVERRDGICLRVVDVRDDKEALAQFWQLVRRFRVEKPLLPAFYACGQLKIGFGNEAKSAASIEELFTIHAYIRLSCQHCRDARQFLTGLAQRWKGIRVIVHDVEREPGATAAMTGLAERYGIAAPSLPTIYVCGRLISGYHTDATTGRQIEDLLTKASVAEARGKPALRRPIQRDNKEARLPPPTAWIHAWTVASINRLAVIEYLDLPDATDAGELPPAAPESELPPGPVPELPPVDEGRPPSEDTYAPPVEAPEGIDLPWFGYIRVRDWGLPAFTLFIGLVDGFNPCAMWVLVFLLSVLVNVRDRGKIAAIAGTFVVVSGLAYFAFMAAWLNMFMLIGIARPMQIALGMLGILIGGINVKDFFAFKKGVTLSIPESAKPGIYAGVRRIVMTEYLSVAIGLSVILAVLVNVVELLCTAGLPAIYTQILTVQQLPAWKNYAYLGLYNVAYMFDDSVMVIAFLITLSHRKMREAEGRWLKLISGLVLLALGLAMLFRPDWLQW